MKKIILFAGALLIGLASFGQCTPDPAYAGETFGFWPSPTEGLPPSFEGLMYSTVVNIKAPINGGEIDPAYSAYNIDSVEVSSIVGLPDGYSFDCNTAGCVVLGGEQACILIEGSTFVIGEYPLTINLTIYASVGPIGIPLPYSDNSYSLDVLDPNGIDELEPITINLGQNAPNPMAEVTTIPYILKESGVVTFEIFNMMGERLFQETFNAIAGINEYKYFAENLNNGIYLYNLTNNGFTQTKRLMVQK
ncbi:MAG: hypothetical protein ACI8XB_001104 [Patiriisocius sp.]|jgi:hypothetical protein